MDIDVILLILRFELLTKSGFQLQRGISPFSLLSLLCAGRTGQAQCILRQIEGYFGRGHSLAMIQAFRLSGAAVTSENTVLFIFVTFVSGWIMPISLKITTIT